MSEVEAERRR